MFSFLLRESVFSESFFPPLGGGLYKQKGMKEELAESEAMFFNKFAHQKSREEGMRLGETP